MKKKVLKILGAKARAEAGESEREPPLQTKGKEVRKRKQLANSPMLAEEESKPGAQP